jgi:hypothetical protein
MDGCCCHFGSFCKGREQVSAPGLILELKSKQNVGEGHRKLVSKELLLRQGFPTTTFISGLTNRHWPQTRVCHRQSCAYLSDCGRPMRNWDLATASPRAILCGTNRRSVPQGQPVSLGSLRDLTRRLNCWASESAPLTAVYNNAGLNLSFTQPGEFRGQCTLMTLPYLAAAIRFCNVHGIYVTFCHASRF